MLTLLIIWTVITILIPIGYMFWWSKADLNLRALTLKSTLKNYLFYIIVEISIIGAHVGNNLTMYLFGSLAIAYSYLNLGFCIARCNKFTFLSGLGSISDFIIGLIISIYLIYRIENYSLQTIILTLAAALYGGLITLFGVMISINYSRREKKHDEELKYKPYLFIVNPKTQFLPSSVEYKNVYISNLENLEDGYDINSVIIYNPDYSYSTLCGIYINDDFYRFEFEQALIKNTYTGLIFDQKINITDNTDNINLSFLLRDMLDNPYILPLRIVKEKKLITILSAYPVEKIEKSPEIGDCYEPNR